MAEQSQYLYDQNINHGQWDATSEDFAESAQANTNYFYQLSLWWWNSYLWHTRNQVFLNLPNHFAEPVCECLETNLINDKGFECCTNVSQTEEINRCKFCPESCYTQFLEKIDTGSGNCTDRLCNSESASDNAYGWDDFDNNEDNEDDDSDDDDDGSMTMEVDDNFKKFLEKSEKHRKEREKRKKQEKMLSKEDEYIEVGTVHRKTTISPPSEQPGVKRKEEMKLLYGKQTIHIMSLEASLQLNYNKNCDNRQPIFWPSIPLKF